MQLKPWQQPLPLSHRERRTHRSLKKLLRKQQKPLLRSFHSIKNVQFWENDWMRLTTTGRVRRATTIATLCLWSALQVPVARAQEPGVIPTPDPRGSGSPGFWVPRLEFRRLDKLDAGEFLKDREIVELGKEVAQLRMSNSLLSSTASSAIELSELYRVAWQKDEEALKGADRDIEQAASHHPMLWLGGGIAAGITFTVLAVWGAGHLHP